MSGGAFAEALTADQMRVLVAIADSGSFSGAARALQRSQSAISYQVASLEQQLGLALFRRTRRRPVLTASGRAVLRSARGVLEAFENLRERARALGAGVEPAIRLAIDVLYPPAKLAAHLRAFEDAFPAVEVDLQIGVRDQPVRLLADAAVDIAVVPEAAMFEARLCERVELVPVAAPDHAVAERGARVSDAELNRHVHLVLRDDSRAAEDPDARTWRLNDSVARHALVLAGVGWCAMPRHQVAEDLEAGRLVKIRTRRFAKRLPLVSLYAAHAKGRPPGPAGRWWFERL